MKKNEIIVSWEQITLAQFEEMCRLQQQHPDEATKRMIEYLYGIDNAEALPLTQYAAMVAGFNQFATTPIATAKLTPAATYTTNGRQYDVDLSPNTFTAGQYIDLTNHIKANAPLSDLLTVVLIPHGHAYNDGYDIATAKADFLTLPVTVAFAIVGFFAKWSAASTTTFLRCLTKWTKKSRKVNPQQKAQLQQAVAQLNRLLEYSPIFSPIAN